MESIERAIASITEDRRSGRLWTDKEMAQATGLHENKCGAWWQVTEERIEKLFALFPGETAAMLAVLTARCVAEMEKKK